MCAYAGYSGTTMTIRVSEWFLVLAGLVCLLADGTDSRLLGFGPPVLFRNSTKNFQVYWNVPTYMCHRFGMNFEQVSKKFGIAQNQRDEFRGDKFAILYDPGDFPALLKSDKDNNILRRNGGVPQEGNLTLHLEYFRRHLLEQIPDANFSGIGVIDFESWRPIFRQNWASLQIYRDYSIDLERQRHLGWSQKALQLEATQRFERAGKIFMQKTLELAKKLRPKASWGYYAYPYCFNMSPNHPGSQCSPKAVEENDAMTWLFGNQNIFLPSLYLQQKLNPQQRVGLVRGRVIEAVRLARKSSYKDAKVLAYYWFKFQDNRDHYVESNDLTNTFNEIAKRGADGIIIWGSSSDIDSKSKCTDFQTYLEKTLGPSVLRLRQQFGASSPSPPSKITPSAGR